MANPFRIVETPDGSYLAGADEPLREVSATALMTHVAVCRHSHGNDESIMKIAGLWMPPVGAEVQLCEPNRSAYVCSVRFGVNTDGSLHAVVYLDDDRMTDPGGVVSEAEGLLSPDEPGNHT